MTTLLEARKTLGEHRRLLAIGSWLSLLAATCVTDLGLRDGASAHLATAAQLSAPEHPEHHYRDFRVKPAASAGRREAARRFPS